MDSGYIDIHTHTPQKEARYILAYSIGGDPEPPAGEVFSAGVHPWNAGTVDVDRALAYLETAPVAAIGEIGLDYIRPVDREVQETVFRAQLAIAQHRRLPVILHCVKAYGETLAILKDYSLKAVIFHGYTGSIQQTDSVIKHGYYISTGVVSLNSAKTVEALKTIPAEKIFAETDTSNVDIQTVYAKLAVILRVTARQLKDLISDNYNTVFG